MWWANEEPRAQRRFTSTCSVSIGKYQIIWEESTNIYVQSINSLECIFVQLEEKLEQYHCGISGRVKDKKDFAWIILKDLFTVS